MHAREQQREGRLGARWVGWVRERTTMKPEERNAPSAVPGNEQARELVALHHAAVKRRLPAKLERQCIDRVPTRCFGDAICLRADLEVGHIFRFGEFCGRTKRALTLARVADAHRRAWADMRV